MTLDFLRTSAGIAALFCIEKTVFTENIYLSQSSKAMTCSCCVLPKLPCCCLVWLFVSSCPFSAAVNHCSLLVFKAVVIIATDSVNMPIEENVFFKAGKCIFGKYLPFLDGSALSLSVFLLCFPDYVLLLNQYSYNKIPVNRSA